MASTKNLAKHYGELSPGQRFALLIGAAGREDMVEAARVQTAGPMLTREFPDTHPRAAAFHIVAGFQRAVLLTYAADLRKVLDMADAAGERGDVKDGDRWEELARFVGYAFRIHYRGWQLFCERAGLDPGFFDATLAGTDLIEDAAETVEHIPGPQYGLTEALAFVRRKDPEPEVEAEDGRTLDAVADALQAEFAAFCAMWG